MVKEYASQVKNITKIFNACRCQGYNEAWLNVNTDAADGIKRRHKRRQRERKWHLI